MPPCLCVAAATLPDGAGADAEPDATGALVVAAGDVLPVALGVVVLCLLLPHAAANRPAVTAMAAPLMRLIVLAPHCWFAAGSRPDRERRTGMVMWSSGTEGDVE